MGLANSYQSHSSYRSVDSLATAQLFHCIKGKYGPTTVLKVQQLQADLAVQAKLSCMLLHARRCHFYNVIPEYIKINITAPGMDMSSITKQLERPILQHWISNSSRKLDVLVKKTKRLKTELKELFEASMFEAVIEIFEKELEKSAHALNMKLNKQFDSLKPVEEKVHRPPGFFVTNNSSYTPTDDELRLLDKGLDFVHTGEKPPWIDILASIEAYTKGNAENLVNLYQQVAKICAEHKNVESNLPPEQVMALRSLRENENIMILPADGRRGTVIMDTHDYRSEIDKILADTTTYTLLSESVISRECPLKNLERKVNDLIDHWKSQHFIIPDAHDKLRAHGCHLPRIYGRPEIHRDGVILKPVVSFEGSPTYELAVFVADLLSLGLVGHTGNTELDAASFVECITQQPIADSRIIVSFCETTLCASISQDFVLNACSKSLISNLCPKRLKGVMDTHFTLLPTEEIVNAIKLCLNSIYFIDNDKVYKQCSGIPIGFPLHTILTNIVMEEIKGLALSITPSPIHLWKSHINHVFAIVDWGSTNRVLSYLNLNSWNLKFTAEEENNGWLPFLDFIIQRSATGFRTGVYRKDFREIQYTDFTSAHSHDHKVKVIKTLALRLETHCSDQDSREEEQKIIFYNLRLCQYPSQLINKILESTENLKETKENRLTEIVMLYQPTVSEKIERECKKFGYKCIYQLRPNIGMTICKYLKPISTMMSSGIVYRINCQNCFSFYIGETGKRLEDRLNEHQNYYQTFASQCNFASDQKSREAKSFTGYHSMNWENVEIIDVEKNSKVRKSKEAMHIAILKPGINKNSGLKINAVFLSTLQNIYNITPTTSGMTPQIIRTELEQKHLMQILDIVSKTSETNPQLGRPLKRKIISTMLGPDFERYIFVDNKKLKLSDLK